jgi:hypothetical protein
MLDELARSYDVSKSTISPLTVSRRGSAAWTEIEARISI